MGKPLILQRICPDRHTIIMHFAFDIVLFSGELLQVDLVCTRYSPSMPLCREASGKVDVRMDCISHWKEEMVCRFQRRRATGSTVGHDDKNSPP